MIDDTWMNGLGIGVLSSILGYGIGHVLSFLSPGVYGYMV
jgi:hypothetical protein